MKDTLPMIRSVLKSQYHASLAMLRDAIEHCPPEEWLSTGHKNAFWQMAYHALFFAHLYLQYDEAAFRPWEKQHGGGDGIEGEPYTQAEVLEYWDFCDRLVDDAVDALDLDRTESGFSWYRMSKLEHQFVNIRHIQHHAAQLIDRVRAAANVGIGWGPRASAFVSRVIHCPKFQRGVRILVKECLALVKSRALGRTSWKGMKLVLAHQRGEIELQQVGPSRA